MLTSILIAATRARVALLVAGLAWFLGLRAPAPVRITIAVLVAVAVIADGAVEEARARNTHTTTDTARN